MDDTTQAVINAQVVEGVEDTHVSMVGNSVSNEAVAASEDTGTPSIDVLQKQIKEARKEAASYRRRLREFEQQQQAAQAELEQKKPLEERVTTYEQQIAELEARNSELEGLTMLAELNETFLSYGIAPNLIDDAAVLWVNTLEALDEDEDEPIFEEWLAERPYLLAKPEKPAAQPISGANPAGKQVSSTSLTASDISKMTPEEYAKNRGNIFAAMARGLIRK